MNVEHLQGNDGTIRSALYLWNNRNGPISYNRWQSLFFQIFADKHLKISDQRSRKAKFLRAQLFRRGCARCMTRYMRRCIGRITRLKLTCWPTKRVGSWRCYRTRLGISLAALRLGNGAKVSEVSTHPDAPNGLAILPGKCEAGDRMSVVVEKQGEGCLSRWSS